MPVAIEVQRHALDPMFLGGIDVHGPAAPGIVDQNIDMTEGGESGVRDLLRTIDGDEVLLEDDRSGVSGFNDLSNQTGEKIRVSGGGEDLHTLGSKRFGDGPAEALARASDKGPSSH